MKLLNTIINQYKKKKTINNPTCYFYDLSNIIEKIDLIKKYAPKNIHLYYAMKANPNPKLIQGILHHPYIKGIEIASYGEMEKAIKYTSNILFTGPGKTEFELTKCIKNKIYLINVESQIELIRINKIAQKNNRIIEILVRINTDYFLDGATENMSGISTKMGIDESQIYSVLEHSINNLKNIKIRGIHVFSASGIFDFQLLLKYNKYVFNLAKKIENKLHIPLDIIDFGGGFGFDNSGASSSFDVKNYFLELNKIIKKFNFQKKELIFELGKFLVAESGYYTSEIIDIKTIKNKKHIILAGGTNHLRLPHATGIQHPFFIIPRKKKKLFKNQEYVKTEITNISGPLCFSDDELAWNVFVEKANIGDIVVFKNSGAYCFSLSSVNMLSHPYPDEVVINL